MQAGWGGVLRARQLSRWASLCPRRSGEITRSQFFPLVQEGAVGLSPKGAVTSAIGHSPGKPVDRRTRFSSLPVSADPHSFWVVCRSHFLGVSVMALRCQPCFLQVGGQRQGGCSLYLFQRQ